MRQIYFWKNNMYIYLFTSTRLSKGMYAETLMCRKMPPQMPTHRLISSLPAWHLVLWCKQTSGMTFAVEIGSSQGEGLLALVDWGGWYGLHRLSHGIGAKNSQLPRGAAWIWAPRGGVQGFCWSPVALGTSTALKYAQMPPLPCWSGGGRWGRISPLVVAWWGIELCIF